MIGAAILVPALLAGVLAAQGPPDGVRFDQNLGARVPATLHLTDHEGRRRPLASVLDERPVVLALVYFRCPSLCTQVADGLLEAIRDLALDIGRDYDLLMVSIDPAETPELAAASRARALERYGRPGAARGWTHLVGPEEAVRRLAGAVGYGYRREEDGTYSHPAGLVVLTPEGVVSRYLFGVRYAPRDLRLALVEASGGTVGGLADRLLLVCLLYDPESGRYGFAVMRALRIGGLLTAAGVVAIVLRQTHRRRRGDRPSPGGAP